MSLRIDSIREEGEFFVEKHQDIAKYAREELESNEDLRGRVVKNVIVNEYRVQYISNYMCELGESTPEIQDGLRNIRRINNQLRNDFSGSFDKRCGKELVELVDEYPGIVCHIFKLDPLSDEVRQSLSQRDSIEILLDYLDGNDIPDGLRPQVEALDDVMKCIMKFYRSDEVSNLNDQISIRYYPDRFWWRHPDQLLSEQ